MPKVRPSCHTPLPHHLPLWPWKTRALYVARGKAQHHYPNSTHKPARGLSPFSRPKLKEKFTIK